MDFQDAHDEELLMNDDAPDEEPASFTLWHNLPTEMKLECIRKMSIVTRSTFKLASKSEKALVESIKAKFQIDYLCIHSNTFYRYGNLISELNFFAKSAACGVEFKIPSYTSDVANRLDELFETVKFKKLSLKTEGSSWKDIKCLQELLDCEKKIDVATVEIWLSDSNDFDCRILKKCDFRSLERIVVKKARRMEEFLKIPQVRNLECIHFANCDLVDITRGALLLVENWMKKNYPLEKNATFEDGEIVFRCLAQDLPAIKPHPDKMMDAFWVPCTDTNKCVWCWKPLHYNYMMVFVAEKPSIRIGLPDFEAIRERMEEKRPFDL